MTTRDMIAISVGNLWQRKLRASLTISGVAIAIAAFVTMLSFGVGMQDTIYGRFSSLGLFTTMQVYPPDKTSSSDSTESSPRKLNQTALQDISNIPGVKLAYPMASFQVELALEDTEIVTKAQALPTAALGTKLFSSFEAGGTFSGDDANQVILLPEVLESLGLSSADSIIGQSVVVGVRVSSFDSAAVNVIRNMGSARTIVLDIVESFWEEPDSVKVKMSNLLGRSAGHFLTGYFDNTTLLSDSLVVRGVLKEKDLGRLSPAPVILPPKTAIRLDIGGPSNDPLSLMTALKDGSIFSTDQSNTSDEYPKVTLDLDPHVSYQEIQDQIEDMGFKTLCFATEYKEVQRFFLIFDTAMGGIGTIALLIASLGIVNTMVMSIVERRREIGVLKSLGAYDGDIRWLFLVESGLIGLIGSIAGIVIGWVITIIAAVVGKRVLVAMASVELEELEQFNLFSLPLWLILSAILFGLLVSFIAGLYPSARAAGVDPVKALRDE